MKLKYLSFLPSIAFFILSFYFFERSFFAPFCTAVPADIKYIPAAYADAFLYSGWLCAACMVITGILACAFVENYKD